MKTRRILAAALVTVVLSGSAPAAFAATGTTPAVTAAAKAQALASDGWYKNQLNAAERSFYNALDAMYRSGSLKTGTGTMDLINGDFEGTISQDQVKAYLNGDATLENAFETGRNAFMRDHADVFYVDYAKLAFSVRSSSDGQYQARLDSGKQNNYFAAGFRSAAEVDTAIAQTQAAVKKIVDQAGAQTSTADKLKAAHDAIVNGTNYTTNGNFVDGVYGALVKGSALCEGYANAYKSVLDALNIPCVIVSGVAENSAGEAGDHAWCAVQVDGGWYAVDVTWDDPINGKLRYDYFLKGSSDFCINHTEMGDFSLSGKNFAYPTLAEANYGESQTTQDNGLVVKTEDKVDKDGYNYTHYTYSYNGMGNKELRALAKPLYIAARCSYDAENWYNWTTLDAYVGYDTNEMELWFDGYVQFAVTEKKMDGKFSYKTDISKESSTIALSEPYKVADSLGGGNYTAPPVLYQANPTVTGVITPEDRTITVRFDENLKENGKKLGVSVSANDDRHLQYSVDQNSITWKNGEEQVNLEEHSYTRKYCEVSFKFSPDKTYNTEYQTYTFQVNGLVGDKSEQAPREFGYVTHFQTLGSCQQVNAVSPLGKTKLENFDPARYAYNPADWGASFSGILLVAKKADGTTSVTEVKYSCKTIRDKIKAGTIYADLGVGYPVGFHPDYDGNITFEAYRFAKQSDGSYKAVKLPCKQNELGLRIVQNKF